MKHVAADHQHVTRELALAARPDLRDGWACHPDDLPEGYHAVGLRQVDAMALGTQPTCASSGPRRAIRGPFRPVNSGQRRPSPTGPARRSDPIRSTTRAQLRDYPPTSCPWGPLSGQDEGAGHPVTEVSAHGPAWVGRGRCGPSMVVAG